MLAGIRVILTCLVISLVRSCIHVDVTSDELGSVRFRQIPIDELPESFASSGRATYVSEVTDSHPIYLYHVVSENPKLGIGKWIISDNLGTTDHVMAFVNSWAVMPTLIHQVSDVTFSSQWMLPNSAADEYGWEMDESLQVHCVDADRTIYFESSMQFQSSLAGFYTERIVSANHPYQGAVYSMVLPLESKQSGLFLYEMASTQTWLIGEQIGVDNGAAYVRDNADHPHKIQSVNWHYVSAQHENRWIKDVTMIIKTSPVSHSPESAAEEEQEADIYAKLRYIRAVAHKPNSQRYVQLRGNELPMPLVGLGTGGLYHEELPQVLDHALGAGYQLFDLAREYGNEAIVGRVVGALPLGARHSLFLESKVWPTELGVAPTTRAVRASTQDLQTNYVDLYLLHWPSCDKNVDWMHCETAEDVAATWQESWRALERAYAEGSVMSIGVSNFDVALLEELRRMAVVLPHVVQNWADHSHLDQEVRQWCRRHDVVYQPYATLRNLNSLDKQTYAVLARIAKEHKTTVPAVSLQFFLQGGAAVIPRASKKLHLVANIRRQTDWRLSDAEMRELGWTLPLLQFVGADRREEL